MEKKNIILTAIIILVVILAAIGIYIASNNGTENPINVNPSDILKISDNTNTTVNTTDVEDVAENTTDNDTIVGDNTIRDNNTNADNNNTTYKVYNPQSDSYVPVIGEKYDDEVNRWYTYDTDGVRYYNTRIK